MIRRPPRSTRTDPLFPYTTLFRSILEHTMTLTARQLSNGFALDKDRVLPSQPEHPEMRESVSIWLFEENGEFAFPRGGIEAESQSWDDRLLQANFSFADGRVLSGDRKSTRLNSSH